MKVTTFRVGHRPDPAAGSPRLAGPRSNHFRLGCRGLHASHLTALAAPTTGGQPVCGRRQWSGPAKGGSRAARALAPTVAVANGLRAWRAAREASAACCAAAAADDDLDDGSALVSGLERERIVLPTKLDRERHNDDVDSLSRWIQVVRRFGADFKQTPFDGNRPN